MDAAHRNKYPRRQRRLVALFHGLALGLLGAHLYVRTLPPTPDPLPAPGSAEHLWWGLWPITYLPDWAVALGAGAVVALIVLDWWQEMRGPQTEAAAHPGHAWLWPTLWWISAALLAAFFLFPIAHTRWGDAFILAKGIAFPDPALRLTHSWQAPLDVALHSQLWLALHEAFAWRDAMPAYHLLSPLAGALYLLVVLALSRLPLLAPPWLPFALLTTLGLMQLFFGYIENYSFAAAGVLAYLWLGLGVVAGQRPLWLAATLLAVTNATHPSTIILAPSLLYLGAHVHHVCAPRNKRVITVVLEIALPMLLIGGATFLFMEASGHGVAALLSTDRPGGGDARWFVPLLATTTRWEQYTMFSWPHLRDWLNNQLLVAPVVLPALAVVGGLWIIGAWQRRGDWRSESGGWKPESDSLPNLQSPVSTLALSHSHTLFIASARFLTIAAGFYLLFTFVWNPDYGGQRDWDLFSLAALPTTVLLALVLPRVLRGRALWGAVAPLIMLQAWHTAAWIYQNTLPWQWPD